MGSKNEEGINKTKVSLLYQVFLIFSISLFVVLVSGLFLFEPKIDNTIRLSDLNIQSNEESMAICTKSIEAKAFICKEKSFYIQLYNTTQEEFSKLVKDCPTGEIIDYHHCIGNYLSLTYDGK